MSDPALSPGHRFCHRCGAGYADSERWPRVCASCGGMTWANPLPVAVLIVPVREPGHDPRGLLVVERAIAPQGLALPGGFLEAGEDWRAGAARELYEETTLAMPAGSIELVDLRSSSNLATLLVFCRTAPVRGERDQNGRLYAPGAAAGDAETAAVGVIERDSEADKIVFPIHRELALGFLQASAPPSVRHGS